MSGAQGGRTDGHGGKKTMRVCEGCVSGFMLLGFLATVCEMVASFDGFDFTNNSKTTQVRVAFFFRRGIKVALFLFS